VAGEIKEVAKLNRKQKTALARLKELGVEITKQEGFYDFLVSHEFDVTEGIEFGFLLAQLNEHEYPNGFDPLCAVDSKIYEKRKEFPPVHFVDSHPHGMQYRVYKKGVKR